MNIELFIGVLILLFLAYFMSDRDIFSPGVIVSGTFLISIYIAMYVDSSINMKVSSETSTVLLFGIGSIVVVNIISSNFYKLTKKNVYRHLSITISPIKVRYRTFLLFFSTFIFVISAVEVLRLAFSLGGVGLSGLIHAFRMNAISGDEQLPSIISNLITINNATGFLGCYIVVNNYFVTRKIDKGLSLLILYPSLIGLLSGARGYIIQYLVFIVTLYYFFYLVTKKKTHIDGKIVGKMLIYFAGMFAFFYLIKFVIGRTDTLGFFDYICMHLVYPLKLLDLYVCEHHALSPIWGEETFTHMIATLGKLGFLEYTTHYNDYANFRVLNGISLGNVYTAFRAYYSDFGMVGVIIIPGMISLIASRLYYKFRTQKVTKIKLVNWPLFFYAYLVYGLIMMFYSNQILEYTCDFGFLKKIIIWVAFDYIFLRGKISFKTRR